jgi:hypothetical protein
MGPELKNLRIVHLEPAAKPPTMTVEATIIAHRYIESRNTGAVLLGSKTRTDTFCERWDLALTHHHDTPWRIASRHDPRSASSSGSERPPGKSSSAFPTAATHGGPEREQTGTFRKPSVIRA